MKPKVIIIAGPTASGKTQLSVELAKKINGEIISADSMQIYRHLNSGTAKITEEEKQGIQHYLIDICDVSDEFSVADFQKLAYQKIEEILQKNKVPIIVGGTGLYISSLVKNMKFVPQTDQDYLIKENLNKRIEKLGDTAKDVLYDELLSIDKEAAEKIDKNNFKRVVRALAMYYSTGLTKTEQEKKTKPNDGKYQYITFVIDCARDVLYNRINLRVDAMIKQNILDEAKWLLNQNIDPKSTAMQAMGYKEFFPYLKGEESLEKCVEKLKQETRKYAKRQITWFKRVENAIYINGENNIEEKISDILNNI
ncbi:MAG: tRNA (adenosine(37)-N6)-dimethylallyltransferase MiaA [Clostridia bacterium]